MTKETKPDAWMPLYIGDWDGDTGHLDCEQDGAYGRLVRHYWRNGPLPDDDEALARIVRMELKRWRKVRPVLAPFFIVTDGKWNHKRVDAEIIRWSGKKAAAVEKARQAASKRWGNDATSNATSMPGAMLEQCPSSSSRKVEGLTGHSTLSVQVQFSGPKEVREAFVVALGENWTASYIDRCAWQDIPDRALIPATRVAANKIVREGRPVLYALALSVLERAA